MNTNDFIHTKICMWFLFTNSVLTRDKSLSSNYPREPLDTTDPRISSFEGSTIRTEQRTERRPIYLSQTFLSSSYDDHTTLYITIH